jgi:predicted nucleic acid-binding protein
VKIYWDSSALIEALHVERLRGRLRRGSDASRPHSLAEVFSTLTKGVNFRYLPEDAAKMVADLARDLDFVELSAGEVVSAIEEAQALGVRGARIHDLMHATAARKHGAEVLMTLDTGGFTGLAAGIRISSP